MDSHLHMWTRIIRRTPWLLLSVGLGVANTIALMGTGPLHPTNTAWIHGDPATYYTGWALFRHDRHLSFPLAWTDRVGYPVGTSIALLDAIPLVAVLLRPASPLLSEPFQYLGLYAALCFVLQAYYGFSLCRRLFAPDRLFIAIGGLFFLLSAPLTWRASGHFALLTHWLILAALDSYFRDPGARPVRWLARLWVVLALAAAITPYIAAMCFLATLAGVARLQIEGRCRWRQTAMFVAASLGIVLVMGVSFGVLVSGDPATYWAAGYGGFSMNLNALINPMSPGALVLPALPVAHPEQYEGYNYLGLGIIVLLAVNLVRRPKAVLWLEERRLVPLVGLGLACAVLAISASVTLGSRTLFEVPLPAPIAGVVEGLRASGRLFWPAYYLIVAAALALTFHLWRPPYRSLILGLAVIVQLIDLTPLRAQVRSDNAYPVHDPLVSPQWRDLGRRYENLMVVPPFQCDRSASPGGAASYATFGKLAAAQGMRTNSYYAARYPRPQLQAHCVDLLRSQLDGALDPRSVYVVTDDVLTIWQLRGVRSYRCERVDGFNLCMSAPAADGSPASTTPQAAAYTLGEPIGFIPKGSARRYATFGWNDPGPDGTWTKGPLALVRLELEAPVDQTRALVLEVDALPLIAPRHPQLDVSVVVNGQLADRWTFGLPRAFVHVRARIPGALAAKRRGLDIEFRVGNPESPAYLGVGPLGDFLGLDVRRLLVRYE